MSIRQTLRTLPPLKHRVPLAFTRHNSSTPPPPPSQTSPKSPPSLYFRLHLVLSRSTVQSLETMMRRLDPPPKRQQPPKQRTKSMLRLTFREHLEPASAPPPRPRKAAMLRLMDHMPKEYAPLYRETIRGICQQTPEIPLKNARLQVLNTGKVALVVWTPPEVQEIRRKMLKAMSGLPALDQVTTSTRLLVVLSSPSTLGKSRAIVRRSEIDYPDGIRLGLARGLCVSFAGSYTSDTFPFLRHDEPQESMTKLEPNRPT